MPINNLNWINKIQVKSSKHASNNIGQNLSRKLAAAKRIFLPDSTCLKILKKFIHTEDEKFQLH